MEIAKSIQTLVADLTVEEFACVLGIAFGFSCFCYLVVFLIAGFINSFTNGYLHYKTREYYGALKFIRQYFKLLKECNTVLEIDYLSQELIAILELLVYQRVLPKFLYKRLVNKMDEIKCMRRDELRGQK